MAGGSPAGQLLGVERRTIRCWEYGSVFIPDEDGCDEDPKTGILAPLGSVQVVLAWFGDASDESLRNDITDEVQRMLSSSQRSAVPAMARLWGDPAKFRLKQLEVTYEQDWLGHERREALLALKARANEKAQEASELESLLQRLSVALVASAQSRPCPVESIAGFGSTSPRWRQLGFQSCDPRTDLRTGILALDCLVHMAERYPLATSQMVREAQSDGIDYPFAVASINITQHLARYLQLVKDGLGCPGMDVASNRVVHRFSRLLLSSRQRLDNQSKCKEPSIEPFCELHAAVMSRLHSNWRGRKQEDPNITVMQFGPIMEETLAAACAFCKQTPMETASEFRALASVAQEAPRVPRSAAVGEEESEDFSNLADSVQQTVQKFSETASIFGTYLHGVISERLTEQSRR
ncbi:elmoC [Symbiodinium natans]|uniref:ElmoC protein n=1 Tax=Symbiodinium natans TaxID=878477 RepID=A0A812GUR7_9DINO|nr:elmoC [Symbiodinium natans]